MTASELLLVASQSGQKLDYFDVQALRKLHTTTDLIAQPHEMTWDSRRGLVYIAHTYRMGGYGENRPKAHEISVVDPKQRSVVDIIDISPFEAPHDVEYEARADLIYASSEANDTGGGLVVIDAQTRQIRTSIPLGPPNAHWLALTPDGRKAYVTHKEAPVISVVDLDHQRTLRVITSPGGAEEVDCSPDGRFAFVAAPMMTLVMNVSNGQLTKGTPPPGTPRPRLLKIDVAIDQVVGELAFDEYLSAVRAGPDGRVIVTEFRFPDVQAAPPLTSGTAHMPMGRGRVNIIDGESLAVSATAEVDELPFTSRFSRDGRTVFVANVKTGSVSVLDVTSGAVRATLDSNVGAIFGGTHGMCLVPMS